MEQKHIGRGRLVASSLAVALSLAGPAAVQAVPIVGISGTGTFLFNFDSDDPTNIFSAIAITGLAAGDVIEGIDYRPATGQLYGVGTTRLYTLDPASGLATQVTPGPLTPALAGANFGVDFNPVVDRIRMVSNTNQNLRLDPVTGAITVADTNLAPDSGAVFGLAPSITSVAYTNNMAGATTTTLYGIDWVNDLLVLIGSPDGTPNSPDTGLLTPVGSLNVLNLAPGFVGFDIAEDGMAFATMRVDDGDATTPPATNLYRIDLATGAAESIAPVNGTGALIIAGIAVMPTPLAPTVQLDAAAYTVNEGDGSVTVNVTRNGDGVGAVSVDVATRDGSALATADYGAISTTPVSFADGDTAPKPIIISITEDTTVEGDENFNVELSNPVGIDTGTPDAAVVTITDGAAPLNGTLQLDLATYSVDEAAGTATVMVTRTGGSAGAASVTLATSDGTATAGSDYTVTNMTVNFGDGDAVSKPVTIPILDDATDEADETFNVTLSGVVGATLGALGAATVTIVDNDATPGLPGGGGGGGGCALSVNGALDPTLPLLFLAAAFYLARRRFGLKS